MAGFCSLHISLGGYHLGTMSGERKKVRGDMVNEDRISQLPTRIIDLILSYLPIGDVIRTSILSTEWRYKWATVPSLKFGAECFSTSSRGSSKEHSLDEVRSKALAHIIDNVLILHSGSIQLFQVKDICPIPDIDRWIVHISRRSIKVLVLELNDTLHPYKLPSSLYACESLTKLKLSCCVPRPPPGFKGFKCLKHLSLMNVTLTDDAFENLISSCPVLRKLSLMGLEESGNLKIDAPNLRHTHIGGMFKDITFGNRLYKLLVISVDWEDDFSIYNRKEIDMIKFFDSIPGVQQFEAKTYFLRYLGSGHIPHSLPTPCLALCRLSFCLQLHDPEECLVAFCLFRGAPNLKVLEVESASEHLDIEESDEDGMWMDSSNSNFSFDRLQVVKAKDIVGDRKELEFIKFLLLKSPVLECLTVTHYDNRKVPEFPAKLLRLRRASARAEIIYGPQDTSSLTNDSDSDSDY